MCFTTHVDFTTWLALAQKTVVITADSPANGTRRVLHMALAGDPANNYVSILTSGTSARATVVRGGVTQAELPLGTIAPGVPFTVALAMAENNIAASLNGAPAVSDTVANMPACDKLWFGSGPAGEQLCGHLAGTWRFLDRLGDVEALSASAALARSWAMAARRGPGDLRQALREQQFARLAVREERAVQFGEARDQPIELLAAPAAQLLVQVALVAKEYAAGA
jgi:hypothetical protein